VIEQQFLHVKRTVSSYKLTWLLAMHRNRLEWLGKLYVAARLWLIEPWGVVNWIMGCGYSEAYWDLDSASAIRYNV